MRIRNLIFLILCCSTLVVSATHNRAGEITYTHESGLTYRFTITTYTYTPSPADRPEIEVDWGDGSFSVVARDSKTSVGEDISKNVYIANHTFPSSGNYIISFEDPNRNAGVINIPGSVNVPFYIETELVINPFLGPNSSPILQNPPIDNGCVNVLYEHNPGALDPDGDSLSYEIVECRGFDGDLIPGYSYPNTSSIFEIDPVSGTLIWDTPVMVGEYNLAIKITEWRYGIVVSSVVRDMQILIAACENDPPEIAPVIDTCVQAGTYLNLEMEVTDPNIESTVVTITASGIPFSLPNNASIIAPTTGAPPYLTNFRWETTCALVRKTPYTATFKVKDNGPVVPLSSFETANIEIYAPKPENLVATPHLNTIQLDWERCLCDNAVGYDIYKRRGIDVFEPADCETGLPASAGYTLIGTINDYEITTFTDDGSVMPLLHSNEYCYRVVAFFADGAESVVSDKECAYIANDAPLITHVDVNKTAVEDGEIIVNWIAPPEIDSVATPPPFHYKLLKKIGEEFQPIATITDQQDLSFIDITNTKDTSHQYQVEFWCTINGMPQLVETSDQATSPLLTIMPTDRALQLNWAAAVPWNNYEYVVYRKNHHDGSLDSLATTTEPTYLDDGLENNVSYCYAILCKGAYWIPDTIAPLLNRIQEACAVPEDNMPPEMPIVTLTTDGEEVTAQWTFTTDTSYQEVFTYYIFYKPNYDADYYIIDSIQNNGEACYPEPCIHIVDNRPSITGCYQMAAVDTNYNISPKTPEQCFDIINCMDYRLPNVFTPNDDGVNDLWIPFPYSNVQEIDLKVHNRWGKQVFETTDPDINWDGTEYQLGERLPEGNYYYSCAVKVYTLEGLQKVQLNGVVMIFYDNY